MGEDDVLRSQVQFRGRVVWVGLANQEKVRISHLYSSGRGVWPHQSQARRMRFDIILEDPSKSQKLKEKIKEK